MSLSRNLAAALDAPRPRRPPPAAVAVERRPTRLALDLTAAGPVGLAFDALDFSPAAARPAESLRAWADRLAARVTYLMEPLVVLELDPVAGEAELRSQSPTARGELNAYYEVRLNTSGTLALWPGSSSTPPTVDDGPPPAS